MTMASLQTFDRGLHMASPLRFLPFSGAAGWRVGQHQPTQCWYTICHHQATRQGGFCHQAKNECPLNGDKGPDLSAICNPLLEHVTTLLLHNMTFYIVDEVRVIRTKD